MVRDNRPPGRTCFVQGSFFLRCPRGQGCAETGSPGGHLSPVGHGLPGEQPYLCGQRWNSSLHVFHRIRNRRQRQLCLGALCRNRRGNGWRPGDRQEQPDQPVHRHGDPDRGLCGQPFHCERQLEQQHPVRRRGRERVVHIQHSHERLGGNDQLFHGSLHVPGPARASMSSG